MDSHTFVFFGIAGSGKGTQVKLLIDFLKAKDGKQTVWAGTGDAFRQMINSDNFTASLVKEKMNQGQYIDDFLTNAVFTNILMSSLEPQKHFFADGYPRTVAQSEVFIEMMKFYKRENIKVIYIEVGKDEATKRNLLRGRTDDTPDGIERRFDEYINKVIPAMEYFKDKEDYTIHTINGEQSVENVHKDIIKALEFN